MHLPDVRPLVNAIGVLGILAGCGDSSGPPAPAAVILNPSAVVFTDLGQTEHMSATVQDATGTTIEGARVSWSTSNPAVATVSAAGVVTAAGVGSADITASAGGVAGVADITVAQTPAQVQKVAGDAQTGTAGQTLPTPLTVELRDGAGNAIAGAIVNFSVTQGGGEVASASVTTGVDGRAATAYTLGPKAGQHQISASSQIASVSAVFFETALAGPAASIGLYTGNGQKAPAGSPVPAPPAVRVTDALGNPVGGVSVTFEVGTGGGSVSGARVTADVNGIATVGGWTLGPDSPNTLIASVAADGIAGNPLTFTAQVGSTPAFDIQVRFFASPTPAQQQAFENAEARWEGLITGDLTNIPLTTPAGACADAAPALNETIDDVVMLARVDEIDGPGATLAQAGPCYRRTLGGLPVLGVLAFDTDDIADIEADGLLQDVILHEMGHVLGFGVIWSPAGLLADPSEDGGLDPHFTGPQAIAAFDTVGGSGYTSGAKVPVEDTGGPGTADAHWRESIFRNELMTGFANQQNPLSRVTVASMADLGYSVDLAAADPYALPSAGLAAFRSGPGLQLRNDIFRGPIREVDARGRVTGLLR